MVEHDDSRGPSREEGERTLQDCLQQSVCSGFFLHVCVCVPISYSFYFFLFSTHRDGSCSLSPFLVLSFSLSLEPRPDIFNKRFVPRRNNAHIPIYCVHGAYMSALARDNARRRGECAFPRGAAVVAREKTSFSPGKPPQNSSYRDVRISL